MRMAIVNNDVCTGIVDVTSEEEIQDLAKNAELVIDITSLSPQPALGWLYKNNKLSAPPTDIKNYVLNSVYLPAIQFGISLVNTFTTENILMGITQAGKTIAVGEACKGLAFWLEHGSLYAARTEIANLKANLDPNLSPFVTLERLDTIDTLLKQYLGIP